MKYSFKSCVAASLALLGIVFFAAGCEESPAPQTAAPAAPAARQEPSPAERAAQKYVAPIAPQTHLGKTLESGKSIECTNNLTQIGKGISMYVISNDEKLPKSLNDLVQSGCCTDALRRCPATGTEYEYLIAEPTRLAGNTSELKVAKCPAHGCVLYADGHVAVEK